MVIFYNFVFRNFLVLRIILLDILNKKLIL